MQNAAVPDARGWMLVRLLILAAVFALGGFLWIACAHDLPPVTRTTAAIGALICCALPVRVLYVGARRYYRTGTWTVSQDERAAWRQRLAARPSQPWVLTTYAALITVFALFSTVAAALRLHRHGPVAIDVFFFTFWLLFLALQGKQLFRQLQKTS